MKRTVSLFTLTAVLLTVAPLARAADLYASSLVSYSLSGLSDPQHVLGEPDQQYLDFSQAHTFVKLDLGKAEEGRDGLLLFLKSSDHEIRPLVTFYSSDNVALGSDHAVLAAGTTEWAAKYTGSETFRYVKIESAETASWSLDAVEAMAITTPSGEKNSDTDNPEIPDAYGLTPNTLIKTADSSAVYVLGADGKRHPFPNEATFFSWNYSFDDVRVVSADTMAAYLIGGSVTIKPQTYLVKLQTVPKVYAVGPNHTLHWIYSEVIATQLYGSTWADEVVDVSDAFWPDYVQGEIIYSASNLQGWETETQPF